MSTEVSGKRPSLVDRRTGELRPVELFVSVLSASSLTYAEATPTQQLPDWVDAHIRMVEYFGGSTGPVASTPVAGPGVLYCETTVTSWRLLLREPSSHEHQFNPKALNATWRRSP